MGQFFLCSFAKRYSQNNLRERNSPGQEEVVTEISLGQSVLNSETFLHRVSRIASSCAKSSESVTDIRIKLVYVTVPFTISRTDKSRQ